MTDQCQVSDDLRATVLEQLYNNPQGSKRILSIQSHVVYGYVGNKSGVFPLQLHGYEVDPLNTVQLSNHKGYKYAPGEKLTDESFLELIDGLKSNKLLSYSHILTGYCGTTSVLQRIVGLVQEMKQNNPNLVYICDPVLGDNGEYYTPKEMMQVYRDQLVKLADVITPNVFELSQLTGVDIKTEDDCFSAIEKVHSWGVKSIVVTSGLDNQNKKFCYCSLKKSCGKSLRYRFHIPIVPGDYVGTGDLFASLLLIWMDKLNGNLKSAVTKVISSIQGVLRRTNELCIGDLERGFADVELRIVQCRPELLVPTIPIFSEEL
uniref:Pyridoxal kinase n=1 Tax=Syphacia muris TaxID=451379 RepID=A0A0N5AZ81_9BILA